MALQSAAVIKRSVLFRSGELTDGTSSYDDKALEYMNQIYRSILSGGNEFNLDLGQPWVWAKSPAPGTLVLQTQYDNTTENATLTMVNGSPNGVFDVAPSISLKGQWIYINNTGDYYRVSDHKAGDFTITLDAPFTDASAAKLPFVVYFLEYDLSPKINRLLAPMVVDKQQEFNAPLDGRIYGVDITNLNDNYPIKFIDNVVPIVFAQVARTVENKIRVRFNSQVNYQTRVSFDYIPVYSDLQVHNWTQSTTGDSINIDNHGFAEGDAVVLEQLDGLLPPEFSLETIYYVVAVSANSFGLAATPGGSAIFFNYASGETSVGAVISTMPIMPSVFTQILDYGAAFYLCTDKNDERFQSYFQLCQQKMRAMIDANNRELSQSGGGRLGMFIPRLDQFSGPKRFWKQGPVS